QPPRSELLLKLSFGNHMPKENILAMIEEVKVRNNKHLEQYRFMEAPYLANEAAKKDPAYPYWLASLRLGIMNAETAIRWAEDTLQLLQSYPQEN
ncbi:MAG TPA: PadR family transcriptional regulator, partial [Mobilitalea sp.]|nr:PadR family transcriptional regulator [Mobilitalea sp.]